MEATCVGSRRASERRIERPNEGRGVGEVEWRMRRIERFDEVSWPSPLAQAMMSLFVNDCSPVSDVSVLLSTVRRSNSQDATLIDMRDSKQPP